MRSEFQSSREDHNLLLLIFLTYIFVMFIVDNKPLMNTVLESSKVILFRVALHDEILVNLELLCVVTFLNCTFSMITVLSMSLKKLFEDMELVNLTPSINIVEKAELRIEPWLINMVSLNIFKYPEVTCKLLSETSYSNRLEF